MKRLLLLSLVAVALGERCGVPKTDNYIVGGDPARRLEFPWQIALQRYEKGEWTHVCGGSIIDKNWILTAAHCVDPRFVGLFPMRLATGKHDRTRYEATQKLFRIDRERGDVVIHPFWDPNFLDYDYALIQLDRPLNFTGAQSHLAPICLPTPADVNKFNGMTCVGSGWGYTQRSGEFRQLPALLQKMVFEIPTHRRCAYLWTQGKPEQRFNLTPRHICAATIQGEGHGVCNGDSGGPLQCLTEDNRWTLAGVASFVKYCGSAAYPNVYARTTAALDWIGRVKHFRTRNP